MCVPLSEGGRDATNANRIRSAIPWRPLWLARAARAGATVAAGLFLCVLATAARADPIDVFTTVAAGPEGHVVDTLSAIAPGLIRLSDGVDQVWALPDDGTTIEARPVARHAGYSNEFGVAILGDTGPGAFESLFTAPGPTDWEDPDLPWLDLGALLTPGEAFAFGIRTPHRTMLSQPDANPYGVDHMVSWTDPEDSGRFFLGFEDPLGGGDWDFNDLVVEVRFVALAPQPAAIAEPASAVLFGLGLAAMVLMLSRRRPRCRYLGN